MSKNVLTNKIILGILDEFRQNYKFDKNSESKNFERLINYIVLSKYDPEIFNDMSTFDSVDVDKNSTFGVDSFALFINDNLICNKDDIAEHRKTKRMDVRLVFIQTKRSTAFDSGEFLKFTTAVKNFLSEKPSLELSEDLLDCKGLVNELFSPENTRYFTRNKPKCELFYATSGTKSLEKDFLPLFKQEEKSLILQCPEFESFTIKLVNADYIIDSYRELENKLTVAINFEKSIPCHPIKDVEQSYIGYLSISEFLKLITGADGNIRKNIFYENVRDFQGYENAVNREMTETLNDPNKIDKFLILNNGVTIVAKDFSNLRLSNYEICDYYIVNGCQTSNVLFQNFNNIKNTSDLYVPVKIIHTTNDSVISSIIRSTNRQTPVPDEAFVSLEKFHKRLQEYYLRFSQGCFETLYYERRSKEFSSSVNNIERPRIVNLHGLIRSFTAVILNEPQLAMSQNPNAILKEHGSKLFRNEHVFSPYFLTSLLLYLFYVHSENGKISKQYIISRYWISWIARVLLSNSLNLGDMCSDKTNKLSESLIKQLENSSFTLDLFRRAISIYDDSKKEHRDNNGRQYNKQLVRLKSFRDIITRNLIKQLRANPNND